MKAYIASYQAKNGTCWDLVIYADNWKEARKEATRHRKEYGELYSVRIKK